MWQTKDLLPFGQFLALRGKEKARYIELHGEDFLEKPPGCWEEPGPSEDEHLSGQPGPVHGRAEATTVRAPQDQLHRDQVQHGQSFVECPWRQAREGPMLRATGCFRWDTWLPIALCQLCPACPVFDLAQHCPGSVEGRSTARLVECLHP